MAVVDAHGWDGQLSTTIGELIALGVEPCDIREWVDQSIESSQALSSHELDHMASILKNVQTIMDLGPAELCKAAKYIERLAHRVADGTGAILDDE